MTTKLVDDTLRVDCLMQAMAGYHQAVFEEREARERYDGYSWGYHGRHYVEGVERAGACVRDQLRAVIAAEVRRALADANPASSERS